VIDGAVTVFDLAHSAPPAALAQRVASMPDVGGYTLRVVGTAPSEETPATSVDGRAGADRVEARAGARRLVVCRTRRPKRR
jgi:hypothetical protein